MNARLVTSLIVGLALTGVGTWSMASEGWTALSIGSLFLGFTLGLAAALQDGRRRERIEV